MKKKKEIAAAKEDMILNNTKTLVIITTIVAVLSLVSVTLSSIALFNSKNNSVAGEEEEESVEYDVSMFESIDVDKFKKLFKGDEKALIYLGRSTCGYCVKFLPNLQQAQKEYGYKTYYLDITTVDDKGVEKIQKLDSFLEENYGYTPMIVVVKDGKILNKTVDSYDGVGYTEYETFEKFLEKVGYKK